MKLLQQSPPLPSPPVWQVLGKKIQYSLPQASSVMMPSWMQLISFSRLLVAHSWSFGLHCPLWQLLSTSSFDKHDFDWFIYLWSLSHKTIEQSLLRDARVPKGRVVARNLCYWLKFQVRLHLANFAGSQSLATTRQRHVGIPQKPGKALLMWVWLFCLYWD